MKLNIFLYSTLSIFFTSCELDFLPSDTITNEMFWKTEKDYQLACNALYLSGLPTYNVRDVYSDIAYGEYPNNISSGTYLPSNDFGPWTNCYKVIATANNIIENAENNKAGVDESITCRYAGEARFFRALMYYDLLRSYGGVPIVKNLLDIDSPELYAPRNSREEVTKFILSDLDVAIEGLPLPSNMKVSDYGRISKTAALSLKSRIALYEGTRQKFLEKGEYKSYLQQAKDAALRVIESKEHSLFKSTDGNFIQNYQQTFLYDAEGATETILSNRYEKPWRKHNISTQIIRTSNSAPTRALIDAFLCDDGLPINYSDKFQGYKTPTSEYKNRDPRMSGTIYVPTEDIFWDGTIYKPQFGNQQSQTGYSWKKLVVPADAVALEGDLDYIIIRYAEVLLNYAEATYELSNSISDSDLDISINELRRRVGMPDLTNAFVLGSNPKQVTLDIRQELRRERLVELAIEGFRYDDLMRWGIAHIELIKPMFGIPDLRKDYTHISQDIWNKVVNGFVQIQSADKRVFDKDKHYLWPIPLTQIALNENLKQNPNW